MKWVAYLKLMRFHKPIGILLLWWPTAWALWMASHGAPSYSLILLFLFGTVIMRAAGCVMNDIVDRNIDLHVLRTKNRPLTSGEVGLFEAFLLLLILLLIALVILLQLPVACVKYALLAVLITCFYPFCKRFLPSPQLILGVAFSMGIPMAFAAVNHPLDSTMWVLWSINFLWIITYDTEYAMVDREDDLRIGVKSTAILFAAYDKAIIGVMQLSFHLLWLLLNFSFFSLFGLCWLAACFNLGYQQKLLYSNEPSSWFKAFLANQWYGLLMWLAIFLSV